MRPSDPGGGVVASLSCSVAASSAVSNVPSQTRRLWFGSRISAGHLCCLTPRNLWSRRVAADGGVDGFLALFRFLRFFSEEEENVQSPLHPKRNSHNLLWESEQKQVNNRLQNHGVGNILVIHLNIEPSLAMGWLEISWDDLRIKERIGADHLGHCIALNGMDQMLL